MSGLSRRHFLRSAAGVSLLSGLGGAAYWSQSRPQSRHREFYYDVSVQPLFCSSTATFQSRVLHQGNCVDAGQTEIVRVYENEMELVFFSPKGKELWRTTSTVKPLTSQFVEIPQDLGWGSLMAVQSIDAESGLSPNIEVGQFIQTATPWGADSHHGLLWRPESTSFHSFLCPNEREGLLLAATNPMAAESEFVMEIFDSRGRRAVESKGKMPSCGTRYWTLGAWTEAPADSEALKLVPGETYLVRIQSQIAAAFPINSWWHGEESGFTMSHGTYALNQFQIPTSPIRERVLLDLVFADAQSQWGIVEASTLCLPNLSSEKKVCEFIARNQSGLEHRWKQELPPLSGARVELSEIKRHLDTSQGPCTIQIESGQSHFPGAVAKVFNFSRGQRTSVQHGRPDDHAYLAESHALRLRSLPNLESENWISNGPWDAALDWRLMIYNLDSGKALDAEVQYLSSETVIHRTVLSNVPSGSWVQASLLESEKIAKANALRVVSPNGVLRISLHALDEGSLTASAHGTSKLKFAGIFKKAPPLIRRNS